MRLSSVNAIFALGLVLAPGASAQPVSKSLEGQHDNNAPITVTSDSVTYDTNGKAGAFVGNVRVVQGDAEMRSDQVRVTTVDGKADKIYATGHVVVNSPASGTATGDSGIYSVTPRIVEMTGNVVLLKAKDVSRGSHLTVSLNTGKAILTNEASAAGAPGKRVQAVIMPKDQAN